MLEKVAWYFLRKKINKQNSTRFYFKFPIGPKRCLVVSVSTNKNVYYMYLWMIA